MADAVDPKLVALNQINAAWAAGLFEGEGCFTATSHSEVAYLKMTDEDVVRRFHAIVGVGAVYGPSYPKNGHKPFWAWKTATFETVQHVAAIMWPWLGRRRKARATEVLSNARMPIRLRISCKNGHAWTAGNTFYSPSGTKKCLTCKRSQARDWKERNRG